MKWLFVVIASLAIAACEKNKTRQPSQEALDPTDTPVTAPSPTNTTPTSSSAKTAQIRNALTKAGFASSEIPTMLCIGWCESHFNLQALGDNGPPNDSARYDWGLFQINGSNVQGCGLSSGKQLYDLQNNANCAFKVRLSQGLGAWSVYKYCKKPPSDPTLAKCS